MNISNFYEIIKNKIINWAESIISMLPNFVTAILVVVGFVVLAKLVAKLSRKLLKKAVSNPSLNNILVKIIYVTVIILGCFIALSILNLEKTVTSLLAGAGILGLAMGFAFQDIATNFISGFMMATKRPFHVGDVIQTTDHIGIVKRINLRTTELTSFQGQEIIIPNKDVFQASIVNDSVNGKKRIDLGVGVSYGDDLRKVKEIAIKAVENIPNRTKDEIKLFFTEFGDSSINFFIAIWVKYDNQGSFLESQSETVIAIKEAFDKNEITIPFPIRTLDFGIKGGEKLDELNAIQISEKK